MSESAFYVGLDLGQAADYTAITILERPAREQRFGYHPEPPAPTVYHLRHLERVTLGTTYPAIAQRVKRLTEAEPLRGRSVLIADATGVGIAVMDLLRSAGVRPVPVTITGGNQVTREPNGLHVPKRDLVFALLTLFQAERVKVAAGLSMAETLRQELLNFRVKIDAKAHDSYAAWREGVHDDLVLSAALAAWYADRYSGPRARSREYGV